jgi:hypothetical protein
VHCVHLPTEYCRPNGGQCSNTWPMREESEREEEGLFEVVCAARNAPRDTPQVFQSDIAHLQSKNFTPHKEKAVIPSLWGMLKSQCLQLS